MQETIKNRTIFCKDNLDILQGMDTNSIDLIYLDPPFNKNKVFTAPIGSSAEGASFTDIFREEDVKEEWLQTIKEDRYEVFALLESVKVIESRSSYNFCYLAFMAIRLIECHRVLKDTGSLYLHCDPTMSHYLKLLMDCIFAHKNFLNEIIWHYGGRGAKAISRKFPRNHDIILYYAKTKEHQYQRQYKNQKILFKGSKYKLDKNGKAFRTAPRGDYTDESIKCLEKEDRIYHTKNKKIRIKYFEKYDGTYVYEKKLIGDTWNDIPDAMHMPLKERRGYPTQKPLKLLERIIKASSNEDEVVLDPFCGCATTCVASEKLNRKWIGIDVSIEAFELVKKRLDKEVNQKGTLFETDSVSCRTDPPSRTDTGEDYLEKKYVYIISNKSYKNEYKVGIAKDWKSRLSSYQTADPDRSYKLEFEYHTHNFRDIEKYIHEKYKNKHEWVKGQLEDIKRDIKNYREANYRGAHDEKIKA